MVRTPTGSVMFLTNVHVVGYNLSKFNCTKVQVTFMPRIEHSFYQQLVFNGVVQKKKCKIIIEIYKSAWSLLCCKGLYGMKLLFRLKRKIFH